MLRQTVTKLSSVVARSFTVVVDVGGLGLALIFLAVSLHSGFELGRHFLVPSSAFAARLVSS